MYLSSFKTSMNAHLTLITAIVGQRVPIQLDHLVVPVTSVILEMESYVQVCEL